MRVKVLETDVARKGERLTIQFDDPELLQRVEDLAKEEERPVSRQALLLIKAAIELLDEQGFHIVKGKLRRGSVEDSEQD